MSSLPISCSTLTAVIGLSRIDNTREETKQ